MFFGPLEEVLRRRRAATQGARDAADAALKRASEKAASYETALDEVRGEIFKEQEEMRRRWLAEQARLAEEARAKAHALIASGKTGIAAEVESAREELSIASHSLATRISQRLLEGSAS